MSVGFGNLFRREVLYDLHSFGGGIGLDVLMCPELPPVFAAHLSMSGSTLTRKVVGGALNLHINKEMAPSIHTIARLSISNSEGVNGFTMISKSLEKGGRLSFTANMDESENRNHIIGLRGYSESVTVGLEVPTKALNNSTAWVMSRISPSICLGVSGCPMNDSLPVQFSLSLDKRIPNTDSTYCISSSIESPSRDIVLGFSQHLVTHRKVYNP
jgi:hypothetical protein